MIKLLQNINKFMCKIISLIKCGGTYASYRTHIHPPLAQLMDEMVDFSIYYYIYLYAYKWTYFKVTTNTILLKLSMSNTYS